jgi:hypothetical protein
MTEFEKQHKTRKVNAAVVPCPPLSGAREGQTKPGKFEFKFILFSLGILDGEKILLVFRREFVKELRKEFPGIVIYSPLEMKELLKHADGSEDYKAFIKKTHFIKKEFGGWIVPKRNEENR